MSAPPRRQIVVPTKLAALAAGVPEATIRKWASRGKLTRYGRAGRAEYDLDELYELAMKARARRPSGQEKSRLCRREGRLKPLLAGSDPPAVYGDPGESWFLVPAPAGVPWRRRCSRT
jgi:hypothetical protein